MAPVLTDLSTTVRENAVYRVLIDGFGLVVWRKRPGPHLPLCLLQRRFRDPKGPTPRLRRWPNALILHGFSWLFVFPFSSFRTAFSLSFSFRVNAGWFLTSQRRGHPYPHPFLVPRGGGQVSPLMPRVLRLCLGIVYNLGSQMAPGRESMHIYYIKLIILGQKIILKV